MVSTESTKIIHIIIYALSAPGFNDLFNVALGNDNIMCDMCSSQDLAVSFVFLNNFLVS